VNRSAMGLGQWLLRAVYGVGESARVLSPVVMCIKPQHELCNVQAGGLAGVAIALLYFFQDKLVCGRSRHQGVCFYLACIRQPSR
jgi:hypothetical protein